MSIERLYIGGFKSIDDLTLESVESFSVFAGANGAGKSNLFDALKFVSLVVDRGAVEAIRHFGGYQHVHCFRRKGKGAREINISVTVTLEKVRWHYELKVASLDEAPELSEKVCADGEVIFERKDGAIPQFTNVPGAEFPNYPKGLSALMFVSPPLHGWLSNLRIFRIDPIGAKEPDGMSIDDSQLHEHGHNVASVLARLENDADFSAQVMEWMSLIAPGLEKVGTEKERLGGRRVLTFKEAGTKNFFPAKLVSDGTIYVLCILTALLSRTTGPGVTLIEEPERGINPKAIEQMVALMREVATSEHPVWVTTHNESLVRSVQPGEFLLASKDDGRTRIRYGRDAADRLGELPLDKAWLTNFFGAGLPW
jgi:predicted ATPase